MCTTMDQELQVLWFVNLIHCRIDMASWQACYMCTVQLEQDGDWIEMCAETTQEEHDVGAAVCLLKPTQMKCGVKGMRRDDCCGTW